LQNLIVAELNRCPDIEFENFLTSNISPFAKQLHNFVLLFNLAALQDCIKTKLVTDFLHNEKVIWYIHFYMKQIESFAGYIRFETNIKQIMYLQILVYD